MKIGGAGGILCVCLFALFGARSGFAAEIRVNVIDADGQPVSDVAVFITQSGLSDEEDRQPAAAVMDQRDVSFVPHVLLVEKGSPVEFPNSDVVAHHVYSFSRPNDFVLPLYKGVPPGPITFSHDGVVTLGCNIHDGMLGYIVVVDTKVFGMTGADGGVMLEVDAAASGYDVHIWSPRIRDSRGPLEQQFATVPDGAVVFKLKKDLRPAHVDNSESVQWDEY